MNQKKLRICKNCVMDTSDPDIKFDSYGICDHCNTFNKKTFPNWINGNDNNKSITKIVSKIKGSSKGKDHDCLIGLSGGIDSSYLTYLAKEVYGLNPLVFHVDAGWNTQIAVNNIEKLVDKLNLDLYTEVINWEEMRDLQLSFFKSGVPHIDTPQDHAFFATMYKFASKYNIKWILTGGNISTECIRNPVSWMYYQTDSRQLLDIHKKFGKLKLSSFPITSILWHKIWLKYFRGIKVERLLDLVKYKKEDAKNLLINKFEWQPYPQKHFESRFTKFYESFWLPKRFGFDIRKVQYSSLILTGQLTREKALEMINKPSYDGASINDDIEYISNKLNISQEELLSYLKQPLKSYKDYKNIRLIYKIGSKILSMTNNEIGIKR